MVSSFTIEFHLCGNPLYYKLQDCCPQIPRREAGCGTILTTLLNPDLLSFNGKNPDLVPKITMATWKKSSNPKFLKKNKTSHMEIAKWSKSGTFQPQFKWTYHFLASTQHNKTLKNAILIAVCNLPFSFVDQKLLKEFL
ncbi:hypothetical protein VP01_308g1 [Puccinia sorghi]|uniref:Uncharacterized protein n=1 Tax=Puccinia sorghi TaxID=27349 RepID=A0A0L6V1F0_9BASI|nr:hypothetical protein VP01_308g1 [Puccinia sorghi]